VLLIAWCYWWW